MDKKLEKENIITERTYKDTVLKKLLSEHKIAIEVANALQDKEQFSEDEKVIPLNLKDTLSDRYNDIAFTVGDVLMVILEHQSTINDNMALRILIYYAKILNAYYIDMKKVYSSKIYKLPSPIFHVLYNGKEPLKKDIICLSEHFGIKHEFGIELKVKVIDINSDNNHEILEKSPSLKGYSHLISLIRRFTEKGENRDDAIKKAINECIEQGVLGDFLKDNFGEVINMFAVEYNKELEFEVIRQEERQEGRQEERKEVAKRMLLKNKPIDEIVEDTGLPYDEVISLKV